MLLTDSLYPTKRPNAVHNFALDPREGEIDRRGPCASICSLFLCCVYTRP